MMIPTVSVGRLADIGFPQGVRHAVLNYLNEHEEEFDVDAIVDEINDLIEQRLPEDVSVSGESLVAPAGTTFEAPCSREDPNDFMIPEDEWIEITERHQRIEC